MSLLWTDSLSEPVRGNPALSSESSGRSAGRVFSLRGVGKPLAMAGLALLIGGICWAAVINRVIDANPLLLMLVVLGVCRDLFVWNVPSATDELVLKLRKRSAGKRAASAAYRQASEAVR